MTKNFILGSALLLLIAGFGLNSSAQGSQGTAKETAEIATAANKFLATLDDAQRGRVIFDFKDESQRKRWSNLPTGIFKRAGLRVGDLTKP
jgi:hypothetical protein